MARAITSLRMHELDQKGVSAALSPTEAEALASTELVRLVPRRDGRWTLLPNRRVGVVTVNDHQIEVRPKPGVRLANAMFLLGFANDPGFRPELVDGITSEDALWPALAQALLVLAEKALRPGLLQGYRTMDAAERVVRGRIRFKDQLARRQSLLTPIEVTFDEFTPDIPENQILLSALKLMAVMPGVRPHVRSRLVHLTGRFEGIHLLRPGSPVPQWTATRINERYHDVLRLAQLILRNTSTVASSGSDTRFASFVVEMWRAFEDFVCVALDAALEAHGFVGRVQLPARLGGAGHWSQGVVPMSVDLAVLDRAGAPTAVVDAKYRVADKGWASNDAYYQMLAYATVLSVKDAWLIYAAGGGGTDRVVSVKNTSVRVCTAALDLSVPPPEVLQRIDTIAEEIARSRMP